MNKLILWDIDGTLLHTGGLAGEGMRAAMNQTFGYAPRRERTFYSGKTDRQIIHETFPELQESELLERLPAFKALYVQEMEQRRESIIADGRVMPGVLALLEHFHGQVVQAPLTGNIAPVARLKLEWLGLLAYLNTDVGAYGDDHHERARLVPIAMERASRYYRHTFAPHDVIIVGDTPHDIRCGASHDVRTVAVATGPYSIDDLEQHHPDAVLADLSDFAAARAALLGAG
ncbi:MAG: HAD hydrolase-like protein [Chloroflexaceae bacterium]|nr:HAD hydrolase-like protein [Chloroflexaceae bacterium]